MATVVLSIFCLTLGTVALVLGKAWRRAVRAQFIREYMFPTGLLQKLQQRRPGLDAKQLQLVTRALRQFFLAHLKSGCRFVSMPSQVADDLWHEFILYTRDYEQFCRRAFGEFMHHTPAVILGKLRHQNAGLRRTWWYACLEENINPRTPTRLPLLFALDAKLGIAGGFVYAIDCYRQRLDGGVAVHCASDFRSPAFDGTTEGFGEPPLAEGGSGACAGGCSGGCGGGGD